MEKQPLINNKFVALDINKKDTSVVHYDGIL